MIVDLISGVSNKLFEKFGYGYKIYTENVKQGFIEPCFYISVADYGYNKEILSNRHKREKEFLTIDVALFLKEDEEICQKLNDMIKPLIYCLEYTYLYNKKIRCDNIKTKIADNVLHIILNYNFNTIFEYENEIMENLEQKGELKNG